MQSRIITIVNAYFSGTPIKENFGFYAKSAKGKKSGLMSKLGSATGKVFIGICLAIAFVSMIGLLGMNFYSIQVLGSQLLEYDGCGIFLASVVSFVVVFIFSVMSASSVLYKGKDMALLSTLPITGQELFISRLAILHINMFTLHLAFSIPAIAAAFIFLPFNWTFVTGSLLFLLFGSVIPEVLGCIFASLIIKTGKVRSNRSGAETTAVMLLLLVLAGGQGLVQKTMMFTENGSLDSQMALIISILKKALSYLVLSKWTADSFFTMHALSGSLLTILSLAVVVGLGVLIVVPSYAFCLSKAQNSSSSAKKNASMKDAYVAKSPLKVLVLREFDIVRSSSAFMQELIGEALVPLILMVVYGISGVLGEMAAMLDTVRSNPFFPAICFGILAMMASFSMLSSTSISREGQSFLISKSLPVDSSVFVQAKVVFHLIFQMSPSLVFVLIMVPLLKIPAMNILWMIPAMVILNLVCAYLGLWIDYSNPMLTWKNPVQAVKQNLNGIKAMGLTICVLLITGGAFLLGSIAVGNLLGYILIFALLIGFALLFRDFAFKAGKKAYRPA